MIREEDCSSAKRIIQTDGGTNEYRKQLVNLILTISAGHPESELFLATSILEDIKYLEENHDEFFVE